MNEKNSGNEIGVENEKIQILEICKISFAEVQMETPHSCNQNSVHKNILKKIENLPEKAKDNILHNMLASKAKTSNPDSTLQNQEMNLRTGGRPARVIINPHPQKQIHFSEEHLDNFVANAGL